MYQAFPIKSLKKRIGYFILYLVVAAIFYLLIIFGIAALLGFGKPYN